MDTIIYTRLHEALLKLDMTYLETRIDGLLEDFAGKEQTLGETFRALLDEELAFREGRAVKTRMKLAKFPYLRTIDEFDFSFQPELDRERVLSLFSLKFIAEKGNVLLIGPPGVGKTHLAVSLGIAACQNGFMTYFTTFSELIDELGRANKQGRLRRKLQSYAKPKVLVIDEMGYLPLDLEQANLFFQLVSSRYEKGSIILTSNKSYADWTSIFPQESIASAILDRLLENSKTIRIGGDSYRLKQKKKLGLFEERKLT